MLAANADLCRWALREEKVEEMPAKKYDAKQTAEALQRVVLVR